MKDNFDLFIKLLQKYKTNEKITENLLFIITMICNLTNE